MRIHVQSLPLNQDHIVDFQMHPSTLVDPNPDHPDTAPLFLAPVDCHVILRRMGVGEVLMTFSAKTILEPICDRCTVAFQIPFEIESSILCRPLTQNPTEEEEDDEGLIFFTKQELFLDVIIREQIFLALPMKSLCDPNCQGLCPACGENLNDGEHDCMKRTKFIEHKAKVL